MLLRRRLSAKLHEKARLFFPLWQDRCCETQRHALSRSPPCSIRQNRQTLKEWYLRHRALRRNSALCISRLSLTRLNLKVEVGLFRKKPRIHFLRFAALMNSV